MFRSICEQGRMAMQQFLEEYDRYLGEHRDKKIYRSKGPRQTTIKTIFGELTYRRRVYEVIRDNGKKEYVYLLDETLELNHVGLISTGLAEQLVRGITEKSYRECARTITELTGQSISAIRSGGFVDLYDKSFANDYLTVSDKINGVDKTYNELYYCPKPIASYNRF